MSEDDDREEPDYPPASRRTYFAEERTVLAWWRTGISAAAVALGVGGILPHLGGFPRTRFLVLAAGYGALALFFIIGGSLRRRHSEAALQVGAYSAMSNRLLFVVTAYVSILIVLTIVALI